MENFFDVQLFFFKRKNFYPFFSKNFHWSENKFLISSNWETWLQKIFLSSLKNLAWFFFCQKIFGNYFLKKVWKKNLSLKTETKTMFTFLKDYFWKIAQNFPHQLYPSLKSSLSKFYEKGLSEPVTYLTSCIHSYLLLYDNLDLNLLLSRLYSYFFEVKIFFQSSAKYLKALRNKAPFKGSFMNTSEVQE